MDQLFHTLTDQVGQMGPLRWMAIALGLTVLCYFFMQGFGPKPRK